MARIAPPTPSDILGDVIAFLDHADDLYQSYENFEDDDAETARLSDELKCESLFLREAVPPSLYDDIKRLTELLNEYTFDDETEFCLLTNEIGRHVYDDEPLPTEPATLVREFQFAIDVLRSHALSLLKFPYAEIPPSRVKRLEQIVTVNWIECHITVERLLELNVDRWIRSRLGTNPDEWTSRLSRITWQLRKVFKDRNCPLGYMIQFPVSAEIAVEVTRLCGELRELIEDLIPLRCGDEYNDGDADTSDLSTAAADQVKSADIRSVDRALAAATVQVDCDATSDDEHDSHDSNLLNYHIDEPTAAMTTGEIAIAVLGRTKTKDGKCESSKRLMREWMRSDPPKLPANRVARGRYVVCSVTLARLAKIHGGALDT